MTTSFKGITPKSGYSNWLTAHGQAFLESANGISMYAKVKQHILSVIDLSGVIRSQEVEATAGIAPHDSFEFSACLDKLIQDGVLREVEQHDETFLQHKILAKA